MALTLSDKTQVRSLPGSLVRPFVAAEEVEMGEIVYINSDGKVALGDANLAVSALARGVVVGSTSKVPSSAAGVFPADSTVSVHLFGPIAGWSGMDENGVVYLSETAGDVTQTAPTGAGTWTREMGYAISSDIWIVHPPAGAPESNS